MIGASANSSVQTDDGLEQKNYKKKFPKHFAQVSWYRNGGLLPADKTVVQTRGNRHSLLLQQVVTN